MTLEVSVRSETPSRHEGVYHHSNRLLSRVHLCSCRTTAARREPPPAAESRLPAQEDVAPACDCHTSWITDPPLIAAQNTPRPIAQKRQASDALAFVLCCVKSLLQALISIEVVVFDLPQPRTTVRFSRCFL